MNEGPDQPEEKPSETPEKSATQEASPAAEAEAPQYRQVSPEDLKVILAEHVKWVESNGDKGTRADLRRADLLGKNRKNRVRDLFLILTTGSPENRL